MSLVRTFLVACIAWGLAGGAAAEDFVFPAFERTVLDNGVVVLLHEKHDVPLIGVEALLRGGAVSDPAGLEGLSSLLAGLLEKGAGERDAATFAEAVAAVGGELSASSGREAITISGEFLSRDAELMVELLVDMLQRPALDAEELTKLRDRQVNFLRAAKDTNLEALLPYYGNAFLFGDHPYGRSADGSEESLRAITHDDLLAHYNNHIGADRLIIAVSGDFEAAAMRDRLAAAFAAWRPAAQVLELVPGAQPERGSRVLLVDKPDATQTYFWLTNVGVAVDYPLRAELDLVNTVFGGRFTSMLNTALRVESGLTYGASSVLIRPSQPGSLAIYSFTATDSTVEAIDMALGVLETLHTGGINNALLDSARNYVLGQYPPRYETAAQLAAAAAQLEFYGLDTGYHNDYGTALADADGASILPVINRVYPQQEDLVFVLLGNAEAIREAVARYGPVTEMAITEPRFRPLPEEPAAIAD